ncbi:MAG: cytochrome c [Methylobacterium sp.]|nr:cytochrome c [Methylobacterium sp.]
MALRSTRQRSAGRAKAARNCARCHSETKTKRATRPTLAGSRSQATAGWSGAWWIQTTSGRPSIRPSS